MNKTPFLLSLLLVLSSVLYAGCNTVEGVGRDVEQLGDSIEDAADED